MRPGKILTIPLLLLTLFSFIPACSSNDDHENCKIVTQNFSLASEQMSLMLDSLNDSGLNPRTTANGRLELVNASDWTSGFFPGILWLLYEYDHNEKWKVAADHYTMNLENEKYNGRTHDMGFKLYTSFGNGYRLTHNEAYRQTLIKGANTLITRYNPVVGCIRSWDHNSDKWDFPVIIDNMVNLELLFEASRITHDSVYYKIAVSHAMQTLKNHFRDDFSSCHVVEYDTLTGKVLSKATHQGYSDSSSWSRGQAWGLYGFTMAFRETGDSLFLSQALGIANYILEHPRLPEDMIPYWDFDDPAIPDAPRDASAGAIISSALFELAGYAGTEDKTRFYNAAETILESLSSPAYLAAEGENSGFLLLHSVGNLPKNQEIDVPLIYADYYFIEANLRRLSLMELKK